MRMVFPHRSVIGAPSVGSVDADYDAAWLTNGLPGFPAKKTGGSMSMTTTPTAAALMDVFAVCQQKIRQAATITLGGSVTDTIPTDAYPADGIPLNWFRLLDAAVNVSSLTLDITGNTDPVIVGEFYAGLSYEFELDFRHGRRFDPGRPFPWEGEFSSLAPYDPGTSRPRRLQGDLLLDDASYAELLAGDLSQRNGSLPVLVIPNDGINDAWLAQISHEQTTDGANHIVTLEIAEIPRVRW